MMLVFGAVAGVLGQQSALAPSASRNPPPIHIPTPQYHHANSVFSSKGEKYYKSESHEKKSKKKKKKKEKSEVTADMDDLFYLFPDPVVIAEGGRHQTDDDDDHDRTQFPFPTKIDIPLPPSYQLARPTVSPTALFWKVDYYNGGEESSKGKKHSKGSSKVSENDHRYPDGGSIYLPQVPDCYEYGGVNRCDGNGESTGRPSS